MYKYPFTKQFKNAIKTVNERALYHNIQVPTLEFEGTVKLHGTNSSVVCDYDKNLFITQSRNNVITPVRDNNGFSAFAHTPNVKKVLEVMLEEIKSVASEKIDMTNKTAVLYGEWCGSNITKGVAIAGLPAMFVLFAVKISDTKPDWDPLVIKDLEVEEPSEDTVENENEEDTYVPDNSIYLNRTQIEEVFKRTEEKTTKLSGLSIYSIYNFPTWRITVDMAQPRLAQEKLVSLTQSIEDECPVGAYFGNKGVGEGIVWRCVSDYAHFRTTDLVFKTKGKKHSVSKTKTIAPVDVEKVKSVYEFADKVVTENRLEQGLDYLKEMQLEPKMENMGHYLKWFANDCLREEADTLKESNLDKKDVTGELNNRAKRFFISQIQKNMVVAQPAPANKMKF